MSDNFKFRLATKDDCMLLFEWANDAKVRANSFNSSSISLSEHKEWFYHKLLDKNSMIYIYEKNAVPVGQIRIDLASGEGLISYSIADKYRGKGYGTRILVDISSRVLVDFKDVSKLVGRVKFENNFSSRAFIKAGYAEKKVDDYYIYEKML